MRKIVDTSHVAVIFQPTPSPFFTSSITASDRATTAISSTQTYNDAGPRSCLNESSAGHATVPILPYSKFLPLGSSHSLLSRCYRGARPTGPSRMSCSSSPSLSVRTPTYAECNVRGNVRTPIGSDQYRPPH
ncbi:hypothetical protein EHS25_005746 [Saitozyma podzolica]|uniref:Uncharacterized protein n=1 Tax=Saitozyma podzolica TaxID=1890683 RepID=A0A427XVU6_9TREE|nr:hypothetical protein EHS25_005746 [Saitozyma podzolica]